MRIAHLSDLHLTRGPLAAQPAAALADALARLLTVEPRPDCVVITGDLADTGHPDEYATLRAILRRCPVPVHLLPGNHDDPAAMIARFGDTPYLGNGVSPSYAVEYPQATLVIANSWVQGSPAGCLGPAQLAWIDRTLAARPDVPAFVCLHHPPVPVGIPFLDGMILDDAAGLADGHPEAPARGPGARRARAPGHLRAVRRDPDDHRAQHVPAGRAAPARRRTPGLRRRTRPASCCTCSTGPVA